jgi:HTH-type transcriptional regulator/antitoxin HipB
MRKRRTWSELKRDLPSRPEATPGYRRARRAYELSMQLRALREESGLTQTELARRAQTSQSAIARLESGGTEPSPTLRTLERIGEVLSADLTVRYAPLTSDQKVGQESCGARDRFDVDGQAAGAHAAEDDPSM